MAATPMMQQYLDAKNACGDALLFFRMGDFYELFYDDARTAARVLGLTLTSRDKGENPIPMAGFPYHQLESYLAKLIANGHRAAVCEQVEDPKLAKGLVKRELTRVISPGTLTDDALLDPRESNYLAAVALCSRHTPCAVSSNGVRPKSPGTDDLAGIAWAELSTGRFFAATVPLTRVADELARINPSECLLAEEDTSSAPLPSPLFPLPSGTMLTRRPAWSFGYDTALASLQKHFQLATLDGLGFTDADSPALRAAGAVLDYLCETQKASLVHIDRLTPYRSGDLLEIDEASRRSLEITRTIRTGDREGSLLATIDKTVTPMGARLLADWITNPLTNLAAIQARQTAVSELVAEDALREVLQEQLRGVYDLERLLSRVATGRASPRDLSFVSRTLETLPKLKAKITARKSTLLCELESNLDLCPEIHARLESALLEDCPLATKDGGIIRGGYNADLDRLRDLAAGGKEWIARYQAEQAKATGIANLKVAYNKVFGYYIEITNSQKDKTPATYIRKQTTVNAERYITPELKEYEEQVITADDRAKQLEYELFLSLRDSVQRQARRLQATAAVLAQLDVLTSLAELARKRSYVCPTIVAEPILKIIDGRHPVLDIREAQGTFVPNDTVLGNDDGTVLLITGPNMAGKSTYIRQVALITLLAQIGSHVPARAATIGIADRIFARVGASDELARGQSTFMVEMTETARILNTATAKSLVILDEIGRGTSTYDGISLAWAIVEHLHDSISCRTLFATHYHELTDLTQTLQSVRNYNVAVKEWEDHVVFLHKIVPGAADKSYGIHVARLAGVPKAVNERAKQILARLEHEHLNENAPHTNPTRERGENGPTNPDDQHTNPPRKRGTSSQIPIRGKRSLRGDLQLTLFAPPEHPIVQELRDLKIDSLTPLQALQHLAQLQSRANATEKIS